LTQANTVDKQSYRARLVKEAGEDMSCLHHTVPILTDEGLVTEVTNFIAAYPSLAAKLFDMHGHVPEIGSGIGKGELIIYFLYDDVTLGGNISSIDVHVHGIPYLEIKAARRLGEVWADFRLGTDEFTASHELLLKVVKLMLRHDQRGSVVAPEHLGNIPKSLLDELRRLSPAAMLAAEETYYEKLFNGRVGSKKFLFFDTSTRLPVFYGKLSRPMLKLERFSSGQTKLLFDPLGG
jgi:hypothetical protein